MRELPCAGTCKIFSVDDDGELVEAELTLKYTYVQTAYSMHATPEYKKLNQHPTRRADILQLIEAGTGKVVPVKKKRIHGFRLIGGL